MNWLRQLLRRVVRRPRFSLAGCREIRLHELNLQIKIISSLRSGSRLLNL